MRVAIDFDDTLMDKASGEMIEGADTALHGLKHQGHEILIFTTRPDYDRGMIKGWLEAHDVPFDSIQCGKPSYHVLIDDRAKEFIGWGGEYL